MSKDRRERMREVLLPYFTHSVHWSRQIDPATGRKLPEFEVDKKGLEEAITALEDLMPREVSVEEIRDIIYHNDGEFRDVLLTNFTENTITVLYKQIAQAVHAKIYGKGKEIGYNDLAITKVAVDREAIISALNKSGCFRVCPIQARERTAQAIATAIEQGKIIKVKKEV